MQRRHMLGRPRALALVLVTVMTHASSIAADLSTRQAASQSTQWRVTPRFESTSGRYGGTSSTRIAESSMRVQADTGSNLFALTLTHLEITADRDVLVADGSVIVGSTAAERATVRGPGDTFLAWEHRLLPAAQPLQLDSVVKVKLPTASAEHGLGSGKRDYALQVNASLERGVWTPWLEAGYRVRGRPPDSAIRDSAFGALVVTRRIARGMSIEAVFDYRDPPASGSPHQAELSLALRYRLGPSLGVEVYAIKGLSDGSPERGGGLALSFAF